MMTEKGRRCNLNRTARLCTCCLRSCGLSMFCHGDRVPLQGIYILIDVVVLYNDCCHYMLPGAGCDPAWSRAETVEWHKLHSESSCFVQLWNISTIVLNVVLNWMV